MKRLAFANGLQDTMPANLPTHAELAVELVARLVEALVWALPSAGILVWRAQKIKTWRISFGRAYVVALKAAIVGAVVLSVTILGLVLTGVTTRPMAAIVGIGLAFIAWLYAHSAALLKLAGTTYPVTVKEARTITGSVAGFLLLLGLSFAVISVLTRAYLG